MQEIQETWVLSLGLEDALEWEMATHSSILAWKILWTEKPGGLQFMGSQRDTAEWLNIHMLLIYSVMLVSGVHQSDCIYIYTYICILFFRLFSIMWRMCSVVSNSLQSFSTVAHQVPLSMGFFRQGYWSGLPFPAPRALPDPRIEPMSPASPALKADSFPAEPSGKLFHYRLWKYID